MNKFDHILTARLMSLLLIVACLSFELAATASYSADGDHGIESSADQDEQSSSQTFLQASNAIQASFQLNLNFQHFAVEVVSTEIAQVILPGVADQFIPSVSKNFRILLQRIISCNAP